MGIEQSSQELEDKIHIKNALIFTLLYFIVLVFLIIITLLFDIRLYTGKDIYKFPSVWGLTLILLYYIIPFVIAVIFGYFFRPFWRNFIFLVILIFLIHFVYSIGIYGTKTLYLQSQKSGTIKINSFNHKFDDTKYSLNGVSFVDAIILSGSFDASSLSNGDYFIFAEAYQEISPTATQLFPKGEYSFSINNRQPEHSFEITIIPGDLKELAKNDNLINIDIELRKTLDPGPYGKTLIVFCNWAAFFCRQSWEGYEPLLYYLPIQKIKNAYSFSLKTK